MTKIELGQLIFSQKSMQTYSAEDYLVALLKDIVQDASTVFWNIHQKEINLDTDEWIEEKFQFRPYDWNQDWKTDVSKIIPNICFSGVEINYYKYLGRGTTTNKNWSPDQWVRWYNKFKRSLIQFEKNYKKQNIL